MKIRFLGAHNCETAETRLVSLLVDDVLALDVGGLSSGLSLEEQLKIKAVLLTHQHYDHVRDIPLLAMNLFLNGAAATVYSIPEALDVLGEYLLNDRIYPDFRRKPPEKPAISLSAIEPNRTLRILDYDVLAVPVRHGIPAVGYQLTAADGKRLFYSGDTGPGLAECLTKVSPQLLITEVTASNKYSDWAAGGGHLTPALLGKELEEFQRLRGYLPPVITVHMNPSLEKEIAAEVAELSRALGTPVTLACEGMEISL